MSAIVVIPARYHSTRFEGKPLALIDNKIMIQHVYERSKMARLVKDVYVATDDNRIFNAVLAFNGNAVMTWDGHLSGTDRINEAVECIKKTGLEIRDEDTIINVQGDEPLIDPDTIDRIATLMSNEPVNMATLAKKIEEDAEISNPNVVKVVFDKDLNALYFSRSLVPFQRTRSDIYKHIGIYGYNRFFLRTFTSLKQGVLEKAEQLEQLRALEHGYKIRVIITERESIGVDKPEDIERVEKCIRNSSL